MALSAEILLPGQCPPSLCLALTAPISFWGGVDPRSGEIIDARHPQRGRIVTGTVLALPGTIGSSSASAVLLELVHAGKAPAAILIAEPDAILLLGLVVAQEMGWAIPPALKLPASEQARLAGRQVAIAGNGELTIAS